MWDVWQAPGHQGGVGECYWGALAELGCGAPTKGQLEEESLLRDPLAGTCKGKQTWSVC